jgi:hypothetical protein
MRVTLTVSKDCMGVRLVCMTVGDDRVAIGGSGSMGAKLFLQLQERLEDFVLVMEIVVHNVNEQRIVHCARDELA